MTEETNFCRDSGDKNYLRIIHKSWFILYLKQTRKDNFNAFKKKILNIFRKMYKTIKHSLVSLFLMFIKSV